MELNIAENRNHLNYSKWIYVKRILWTFGKFFFRNSPRIAFGYRNTILRLFGAKIGKHVHIYSSTVIWFPWNLEIGDPDFVNAPPKLRFVARYVEKWFHCEVLLRQEECLSEVSPVFRHPYPDCRDSFGCLKHLIDTHPNLVNGNESLQFLIYLIGDEANADMCLYPTFCKMKHRTHFQSSF